MVQFHVKSDAEFIYLKTNIRMNCSAYKQK